VRSAEQRLLESGSVDEVTVVAVVEFGARVRVMAVMAGGQSGDARSPHFANQISRYAGGRLRQVYFYPDELTPFINRRYHPGDSPVVGVTTPAASAFGVSRKRIL